MKPGKHGSNLKAKKRNISRGDIKRSLTYVNGVSLRWGAGGVGWGGMPSLLLDIAREDPYRGMRYMVLP